jgi:hypothetical protein
MAFFGIEFALYISANPIKFTYRIEPRRQTMRTLHLFAAVVALIVTSAALGQDRYDRRAPNVAGTWYLSGEADKPCTIAQPGRDQRAVVTNERGESANGTVVRDRIRVPAWDDPAAGGLHGRILGSVILWSNGTYWTRSPIF